MMDAVKKLELKRPPSCVIRFLSFRKVPRETSRPLHRAGPSVVENTQKGEIVGSADKVIILVLANLLTFGPATSGEISSQRRLLFFFDKIEVNGEVDVFLSKGKRNREATIYADSEIIGTVLTKVSKEPFRGCQQHLSACPQAPFIKLNAQRKFPVEIIVSIDKLTEIRVHGGSNLTSAGLNSDKLSVLPSTGKVHLENLISPTLQLRHEGSGVVVLRGRASTDWAPFQATAPFGPRNSRSTRTPFCIKAKRTHTWPHCVGWMPACGFRKSHAAQETGKDGNRSDRKRNRERYYFGSSAFMINASTPKLGEKH